MKTERKLHTILDCHQKTLSFLAITLFIILYQYHKNIIHFPYDSGDYWKLSDPKIFNNFPNSTIRGYFFPFLLWPAHWLTNIFNITTPHFYRLYTSVIYGYAFAIIFPYFYVSIFGGTLSFVRRLITPTLMVMLFPGVILYPLSDLPSFTLLVCCFAIMINMNVSDDITLITSIKLILLGVLIYGAYNTRTIYLFVSIGILVIVPFIIFKNSKKHIKFASIILITFGILLAAIPQSLINYKNKNTYNPLVMSQPSDKSLFALQLMWGITMQRYSTFMNNASEGGGLYAVDQAGVKIFEDEKLTRENVSIKKYFQLFFKYPQFFMGSYVRHIVNGLDLRDGEVYFYNKDKSRNLISTINFIVLFISSLVIFLIIKKHKNHEDQFNNVGTSKRNSLNNYWMIYLSLILLPVITIIPGALESRFFLPLHMLLYMTIAFNGSFNELYYLMKNSYIKIIVIFMLSISIFFSISHNTISQETPGMDLKYKFVIPNI